MARRSASTMSSMSAPCVDSISAPRTARKRCTGTATETITSPRSLTRTMLACRPLSACVDFRIALAVFGAELLVERQIAAAEPAAHGDEAALHQARLFGIRRRQVEAQHVAAAVEIAAVEDQHAVAVVDARARLGRRHQAAQHRRDALGIDGEFDAGQGVVGGAVAFAGLQFQQAVGIDGDGVGLDGGGGRDGAGDDLALHQQALHARVDQAGAELREIQHADDQRDEAGEVEEDDAAGEAGEALRDEEAPRPSAACAGARRTLGRGRRGVLARAFGFSLLRHEFRGSVEHVVQSSRVDRSRRFYRKPGLDVSDPVGRLYEPAIP